MESTAVAAALEEAIATDAPTTKRAAGAMVRRLQKCVDYLEEFGALDECDQPEEWVDELDRLVADLVAAGESLADTTDADERESAHAEWAGLAGEVKEHLVGVLVPVLSPAE